MTEKALNKLPIEGRNAPRWMALHVLNLHSEEWNLHFGFRSVVSLFISLLLLQSLSKVCQQVGSDWGNGKNQTWGKKNVLEETALPRKINGLWSDVLLFIVQNSYKNKLLLKFPGIQCILGGGHRICLQKGRNYSLLIPHTPSVSRATTYASNTCLPRFPTGLSLLREMDLPLPLGGCA